MFKVGDKAYLASMEYHQETVVCPDCAGKKYLTVILGDGTELSIDCCTCQSGYDPPRGYVNYHSYRPMSEVQEITIDGVEYRKDGDNYVATEYQYNKSSSSWRTAKSNQVSANKAEAQLRAEMMAREASEEALKDFLSREKPNHTWAWNATYHRRCMKQALKDYEYHKAKIEVAKQQEIAREQNKKGKEE
jgi:hypothetical protein